MGTDDKQGVLYEIKSRGRGKNISMLSDRGKEESEVLFPEGTRFRVLSKGPDPHRKGVLRIKLEAI